MNLNYIKAFYHVAKLGSISQAARFLGLAQPTVTKKVRLLEEEIGKSLVRRGARGVQLTEEGKKFYNHAKKVIEEIDHLQQQFYGKKADILKIGMTQGIGSYILPKAISDMHTKTDMSIHVQNKGAHSLELAVETDIYIGPFLEGLEKTHQIQHLHDFSFRFYAAPAYLKKKGIPKKIIDLKRHDMVGFSDERRQAFEETKFSYLLTDPEFQSPKCKLTSAFAEAEITERGMGIALLSDIAVKFFKLKVERIKLEHFEGVKTPAYFFIKKETGRDKALFIQKLYRSFQDDLKQLALKA